MKNAFRTLRRSPGFVVTAVVVLAFGCAFTGAVFSTVSGWLSDSAAIPNSDRLVFIAPTHNGAVIRTGYFKETSFARLVDRRLRTVNDLFMTVPTPAILSIDGGSLHVRMEAVSGAYFQAVGEAPRLGRALGREDDGAANGVPVVLGESAWRRLFASDPRVVGRAIRVSGLAATVVGVMPDTVRGFTTPSSTAVDVWAPLAAVRSVLSPSNGTVQGLVFGRLAEGTAWPRADAEMRVAGAGLEPDDAERGAAALPVENGVIPDRVRMGLRVAGTGLVALSSLVLLIACANLTNLLLARGASRAAEVAIRMALGASPSQILRSQLLETGVVTALGGGAGFALVAWAGHALGRFTLYADGGSLISGTMVVNAWVIGYFFLLIASASLAIGLLPALRAIHIDPVQVLASSGTRGRSTGRFERKRTLLVASQVAASTVLLVVAGLFVRSALRASRYDVAFDRGHVAMGSFDFNSLGGDTARGQARQDALLQVARTVPGVTGAAASTGLPAGGGGELVAIEAEGSNLGARQFGPACRMLRVSPGFFGVVGLIPVRGRDFTAGDRAGGSGVVIVNDMAAARLWPGADPVGRRMRISKGAALDVVGLVPESDRTATDTNDRCDVFVPMAQQYAPRFILAVTGPRSADSFLRPFETTMAAAAPDVAMFDVTTAEAYLNRAGGPSRSIALALAVLGAFGLTIAVAGLYGVMSYVVGLRRAEFGIRKVLGATDAQIYRLVSFEACRMLGLGIAAGLPIAYLVSVLLGSGLVGVTSHDAVTYLSVPSALVLVGVIAAWWPARRAARVEPAVALRDM